MGYCRFYLQIILGICVYSQTAFCQFEDNIINQFTLEDGLPSMTVYDIVQDSKGYIWAATESGVSRFDGYNFSTLTAENGLIYNEVVSMVADSKDRIWLNTSGPVSYIKEDSVYFLENFPNPNLAWNYQVFEDSQEDIWILNRTRIHLLDGATLVSKEIQDNRIAKLKNALFLGKHEDTIYLFEDNEILIVKNKHVLDKIPFYSKFTNEDLYKLKFLLQYPNLYCSKEDGLSVFNLETNESKLILPDLPVVKELILQGRKLLASDTPDGLHVLSLNENNDIDNRSYMFNENNICGLFKDDKNYLWVPSYKSGIYLLKPESDLVSDYFPSSSINTTSVESSYKDPNGVVWIGSHNGILFKLSENRVQEFKIPFSNKYGVNRILDMDYLAADKLMLAMDVGLVLFDHGKFYQLSTIATKQIDVKEDTILISAYNCTSICPLSSFDFDETLDTREFSKLSGIKILYNNRSYACLLAKDESIWISDEREGLLKITKHDTIYFSRKSPIFKTTISKLVSYNDNTVLAATKGEGLIFISGDEYFVLDRKMGLSNNSINDLHIEGSKVLVSTNNGLNIVSINDFASKDIVVEVIDGSYGLKSSEIRSANFYDDQILLATYKGLVTIGMDKLDNEAKEKAIPFYINQVRINGNDVPLKNNYALHSDENNLLIEYSGLSFSDTDKLLYAYKMEGVDEDWIYTRSRQTHYSSLEPGEYTFFAALVTDKSKLLGNSKSLNFTIQPHYTDSLWYRSLLFLFGFFLVCSILYFYSLRREKRVLSKMVEDKTSELDLRIDELAEANYKLEKSNQDLQNFAHVTSHDLKSPLRNVTSFIQLLERKNQNVFDEKDKAYIQYSKEGVTRMETTINDLLLYSSIDKPQESKEIDLFNLLEEIKQDLDYFTVDSGAEILIEGDFPVLLLQKSKIKQLFQNLIENGLKYNKHKNPKVSIHCEHQEQNYLFSVKDNGIGIDKAYQENIFGLFKRLHSDSEYSGTGIGLAICKRVVESYGGKIWLDSVTGYGTTFYFTLPKNTSIH